MDKLPSLLGIPFLDRGETAAGCDCWGLTVLASAMLWGRRLPKYAGYTSAEDAGVPDWIRDRWGEWDDVPAGQEVPGDVLVFAPGGVPMHVGLVLQRGLMLHVLPRRQSCVERYQAAPWRAWLVRACRWK